MDSDDEMLALPLEDEQAFDDDLRSIPIIASLKDMLDAEAEKRKRPRRENQGRGEEVQASAEDGGHTMLQHLRMMQHMPTIFGARQMSKGLFMNILHGVREFDPYFKLKHDAVGHRVLVRSAPPP
ncbi:hypothetical protein QYE76_065804 [Lolium multiflorum]|uniref:Uncharacterized protein n=1 Tax=Lolium multiflorum TaxID=4521 RepID=A0AAD8S9J9_LOLMU|nr:hypothetical protein QYE76_065804 [Lolium multiflorum]